MSKVFIEESTLTSIGDAIREKTGTTGLIAPQNMGEAISAIEGGGSGGGGYVPTDEELKYSTMTSIFSNGNNAWVLKEYGDRVYFESTAMGDSNAFSKYPYDVFNANAIIAPNNFYVGLSNLFSYSTVKEITGSLRSPNNQNGGLASLNTLSMFGECNYLRTINDDFLDSDACYCYKNTTSNYTKYASAFYGCYSLRKIPKFYFEIMRLKDGSQIGINSAVNGYKNVFTGCAALDEIDGLYVVAGMNNGNNITSNMFGNTFDYCFNLSKMTFKTNADGTPLTAKWTSQVIDMTGACENKITINGTSWTSAGVGVGYFNESLIYTFNSGYLQEDLLDTSATPTTQYYVGDGLRKYWTTRYEYGKYGHTEAVETINSLPDTSAAGGGNTIKFPGIVGKYTDYLKGRTNDNTFDSSISTLTADEIAVAAAKGWTVSLV